MISFFSFYSSFVLLRYLFKCHERELCMLPLSYSQFVIKIKQKPFQTKSGLLYMNIFFSFYLLNSYHLFIHHQAVFCKFNQTLVFPLFSLLLLCTYTKNSLHVLLLVLSLSSSSVCSLIKIHR